MKTNEIIRELMEKDGMKFGELAKHCDLKTNALASRMKRGNFSTNVLNQMLEAFGYKIMLVPNDVAVRSGWYEVEDSRTDDETDEQ